MYSWKLLLISSKVSDYPLIEDWARADIESNLNNDYDINKAFMTFLRRCCYFECQKPSVTSDFNEKKDYYAIVKKFLECGAHVDWRDSHGLTPVIYVVKKGDVEALKLLIKYGTKIDENIPQCPPLIVYAEREGH
ncbi:MAG TPA: ankyrin repeat domain-containing protein, partial [Candidatus Wallbacteria bacterium]|nr:ankyrin repeat domain-containing protein [Candidatus Wallbacteria bacterium]